MSAVMSDLSIDDRPILHVVFPRGVPFRQLIAAERHFLRLLSSVAAEVLPEERTPVTWVFDDFAEGSLDLAIRPEPATARIRPEEMPRLVDAIAKGIQTIERTPTRPPFFNDAALQHARDLAGLEGVRVQNGSMGSPMTNKLRRHVDELFGQEMQEIGTVEGTIESLTVRQRRVFNLYGPLTDELIECSFGHRIATEDIGRAVEKRVAVHGVITYRGGEISRVLAESIEVLPEEDLPSADDVFGILAE